MDISAISPLGGNNVSALSAVNGTSFSNINPLFQVDSIKGEEEYSGAGFIDILTSAVENVKITDAEKNQMEYLLSVGELDNPAELTIAMTKAQTAIELLTQIRTKTMDSFTEIMRMSV